MTTVKFTAKFERVMRDMASDYGAELIKALSTEYGFSESDATARFLDVNVVRPKKGGGKKKQDVPKAERVAKPGIPLPWGGKALGEGCCHGIRLNHGLYTQCTNAHLTSGDYCETCQRQADISGKPTYGTIEDRISQGNAFRDPKGKGVVPYGNILKKLKIDPEFAKAEASKFGITLTDDDLVIKEGKRGRPKKTSVSDSESSDGDAVKRPRGRPRKERPVQSAGDDLIAALAQSVQSASPQITENTTRVSEHTAAQEAAFDAAKAKRAAKKKKKDKQSDDEEAVSIQATEIKKKKKDKKKPSEEDSNNTATEAIKTNDIAIAVDESPKAATPKAPTPKAATPKAPTPKAEEDLDTEPDSDSDAEAEAPSVKCKIVVQDGVKYAITSDNDAYYADGIKKGEYFGSYEPSTGVVTEEEFDSDEESDE